MKLTVFASGSTGNCALLQSSTQNILLDAGISARRIKTALTECGSDPAALDGILITHEHADHIKGLSVFLKQYPLPVYAPGAAADILCRTLPGVQPFIRPLPPETPMALGELQVLGFPTPHDAAGSFGYRIKADGAVFAIATDTGCVTQKMLRYLSGADTVLIEANHDEAMLKNGPYPEGLKRRILSPTGHLSNAECTWLAAVLSRSGTGQIILGHLSRENNIPGLALRTVRRGLETTDAKLFLAPELGHLEVDIAPCFA